YYTNGLFLNFRKAVDSKKLKPAEDNRIWEIAAGHQMYNAFTAAIRSLEAIDRPIAAYLYLSLGQRHCYRGDHMFNYNLSLGSIGKRAFGEVLQVRLHRLFQMYEASGWEYQLRDAWSVNSQFQYHVTGFRAGKSFALEGGLGADIEVGTHKVRVGVSPLLR